MKVKNTLEVDLIFASLPDKVLNFIRDTDHRYTAPGDARVYIRKNFPSHRYNYGDFETALMWCEENLGNNFIWEWTTLYFKTEKDKTFFLLRWA